MCSRQWNVYRQLYSLMKYKCVGTTQKRESETDPFVSIYLMLGLIFKRVVAYQHFEIDPPKSIGHKKLFT